MGIEEIPAKKAPWQSKTLWVALIGAVSAFIPAIQKIIVEHPEAYAMGLGVIFSALRLISSGKISIE